ncbi:MAG: hypothetical protein JWM98_3183 [Thermoleophilia bacterium]|nr:hypothetical protein [Thermoleophilia bacterium]
MPDASAPSTDAPSIAPLAADDVRDEVVTLLRQLVSCDTSNPPGHETQALAIIEAFARDAGLDTERVVKEDDRANLIVRLRGSGGGPSLGFLGHLDVVPVDREDWSEEPFAAVERDGAIWGRGTVDMKCQVAATTVALARLARAGFEPRGDIMLILVSDEEVGDAEVGAPHLVEARPDLNPDFVIGEGSGERYDTPVGPVYLLDCGVKRSCPVTITALGETGDASLPDIKRNAIHELGRLIGRLEAWESPTVVVPELEGMLDVLAPGVEGDEERVAIARRAHPGLDQVVGALTRTTFQPVTLESPEPLNVVARRATMQVQAIALPGVTRAQVEAEVREALGEGHYELEVEEPAGGLITSPDSPLRDAIEAFLAEHDPEAQLVPALGYGFADCHLMREHYDSTTYGFIPFRNADPMQNLATKHGADERIEVEDLVFQTQAAHFVAQRIGQLTA